MYSLIKHNNGILYRSKYIARGDKLSGVSVQRYCSLCYLTPLSGSNIPFGNYYNYRQQHYNTVTPCSVRLSNYTLSSPSHSYHTSAILYSDPPLKPSSKVEESVHVLKEKVKEQEKEKLSPVVVQDKAITPVPKKSLKKKILDEIVHYYHGFRLLFIDINISRKLVWRLLMGKQLTRREQNLLVRTVGDLFRLVPFSVFIIVPFMELLLPVFIKLFPGMLPSTFQTTSDKEDKMKQSLKVKIEMAKFLQRTLNEMAVSSKGHSSDAAKDFGKFFEKVRTSGELTSAEEIMKFSKLFEDEITLDSLPRPQLMALCRVLEMNPIGTTYFLRFQLRLKLRSLIADDMMIKKEGVQSLSQTELQMACRARGMRALGVSEERLKAQLSQWLELSLENKVPPSLLLLSQAFMLPETTPTTEKLAATISALPDSVATRTKAVIGEREGKVDYKTKIEVIKEEVERIKEEKKEQMEEESKLLALEEATKKKEEVMVDSAPTLLDRASLADPNFKSVVDDIKKASITEKLVAEQHVTNKDVEVIENALETLGKDQKKLLVEKEELEGLKEDMEEYQEDLEDLKKVSSTIPKDMGVHETKAAQRLYKKVNSMIGRMDSVLKHLEHKEQQLKLSLKPEEHKTSDEVLRIDELIGAIKKIQKVSDTSKIDRIVEVIRKMDTDKDGILRVDAVLKVLELIGHESVKLNKKQIEEIIEMVGKEETIEMDDQIMRALKKDEGKPPPEVKTEQIPLPPPPPEELKNQKILQKEKEDIKKEKMEEITPQSKPKMESMSSSKSRPPPPLSPPRPTQSSRLDSKPTSRQSPNDLR